MSDGRNKLNDFSLLKSLVGGKSIKDKTDRLRKAHAVKRNETDVQTTVGVAQKPNIVAKQERQTRQERVNQLKTPFRMPQYGQKQHEELFVEMPEEQSHGEIIVEIDLQREWFKEEQRLFKWLCQRFPKCFNPKDKRPLKIGISDDIEVVYLNEHFSPVDQYILKSVIRRYVGDTRYQRSVLEHKQRFNLYGKPVDDFSDDHIAYAKQRLDEIAEKAYLRSQGIDIKTYYQQKQAQERQEQEANALEQSPPAVDDNASS